MSFLVTRPEIPVPESEAMSTPCSAAIFLTTGEERVRSRSSSEPAGPRGAAAGAGAGAAGRRGAAGGARAERRPRAAGADGAEAPAAAAAPSASITATTVLIATVSPSLTMISRRTPAAGDGISASTLSVEISNSGSSRPTFSPGFFSHLTTVPSWMLSPICGMITSTGIDSPRRRVGRAGTNPCGPRGAPSVSALSENR